MSRWAVGVLLFLALVGLTVSASSYTITAESGIDTPETTVKLEGSTFAISGIAAVSPGETITTSISVPDHNDGYRVYVYGTIDGSREILDTKYTSSGSSMSFDTDGYDPGLYTFALHADGDYQAVYPFIVRGATVDAAIPDSATSGDSVTLNADVTPTAQTVDVADVEFVVFGNGVQERITASTTESGYIAQLDTEGLPAGEYTVYAVALNASQTATGDPEPIGLSAQQTLTLEEQPTESGGQQTTTTTTATQAPPENTTTTTTVAATSTTPPSTATSAPATATDTTPAATETSTPNTTAGTSTMDGDVHTPNPTTTTSTSAPGFSVGASVVAVLTAVVFWRRQIARDQP